LRRSGRNKDKEVYDSDHAKTVASGSKVKRKGEKQGRKRSRETSMSEAEKKAASGKPAALKTCKKGWKKGKKDSYFRGPLKFLTMCYVDGKKCNDNIVFRRRPPTKVWTAELLSEREAEELSCRGFGYGELEEDFVEEEGDQIPNNIEFKCTWDGNNSGTNATMPYTKEKEKDVQEVEVSVSDIGVNEQTHGSGKDLIGLTKNSCADVVVEKESLFGFDRQENKCGVLTHKAFESVADEVERSIEKSKIMEIHDRPSFSFGVTQDFDVIPVTNNEKKVLTPMPISAYTPEGEAIPSQQSDRLQMESVGQDYVETNILDTWALVRNYMEEYKSNDSPFRLFLPTFVVDKDSFSQTRNDDGRFEIVAQHVESVTRATSELNKLKKIDLVFLSVDNEGHRFLLTFDLKYGAVTMFDQKKKGAKIGNSIVAEMLHADFGRYLYGLDHIKSRNIITTELEIGEYDWKTATVRPYAGTSEGAHGSRIRKYVVRCAFEQRTSQDKMNGTLI
ncbi:hypothetical protein Tco_0883135, partial [Tanacetum coccineum]